MSWLLLAVPRFIGYWLAAIVGYSIHWGIERPLCLVLVPVSRSQAGRRAFIRVSRTRLRPVHLLSALCLTFLLVYRSAWVPDVLWLVAIVFALGLFMHHGRTLTIANQGAARWEVHLNALRADKRNPGSMWKGVFAELDELVLMADAAHVECLSFKSSLLVNEASTQLLRRRLERALSKHGLLAGIEVGDPKPMGTLRTGLIHVLLARQRRLKAKRHEYHARRNLKTRAIEINFSRVPPLSSARSPQA